MTFCHAFSAYNLHFLSKYHSHAALHSNASFSEVLITESQLMPANTASVSHRKLPSYVQCHGHVRLLLNQDRRGTCEYVPYPACSVGHVEVLSVMCSVAQSFGWAATPNILLLFYPIPRNTFLHWVFGTDFPGLIKYHRYKPVPNHVVLHVSVCCVIYHLFTFGLCCVHVHRRLCMLPLKALDSAHTHSSPCTFVQASQITCHGGSAVQVAGDWDHSDRILSPHFVLFSLVAHFYVSSCCIDFVAFWLRIHGCMAILP